MQNYRFSTYEGFMEIALREAGQEQNLTERFLCGLIAIKEDIDKGQIDYAWQVYSAVVDVGVMMLGQVCLCAHSLVLHLGYECVSSTAEGIAHQTNFIFAYPEAGSHS